MIKTKIEAIPKVQLCHRPTPLEQLDRLSEHLNGPTIWIKRDDCTGLALGGNKTRKLEFLIADALKQGADTLVTVGAIQSNHVRQTVAAAAKCGLDCWVILADAVDYREEAYRKSGNRLLDTLLGARVIECPSFKAVSQTIDQTFEEAKSQQRSPFLIPLGGSTALGALGYVICWQELLDQTKQAGFDANWIVHASGSGGTQAGLVAGMALERSRTRVCGITVSDHDEAEFKRSVHDLAMGALDILEESRSIPDDTVIIDQDYVGQGYGLPTSDMVQAVKSLAELEGILLDPVYTGKAMAGLIQKAKNGEFSSSDNIVFLHTGGTPGLFAYQKEFE